MEVCFGLQYIWQGREGATHQIKNQGTRAPLKIAQGQEESNQHLGSPILTQGHVLETVFCGNFFEPGFLRHHGLCGGEGEPRAADWQEGADEKFQGGSWLSYSMLGRPDVDQHRNMMLLVSPCSIPLQIDGRNPQAQPFLRAEDPFGNHWRGLGSPVLSFPPLGLEKKPAHSPESPRKAGFQRHFQPRQKDTHLMFGGSMGCCCC